MEIAIIKRESTGTGANTYNENETVAKFEIMDGAATAPPARMRSSLALRSQPSLDRALHVARCLRAHESRTPRAVFPPLPGAPVRGESIPIRLFLGG